MNEDIIDKNDTKAPKCCDQKCARFGVEKYSEKESVGGRVSLAWFLSSLRCSFIHLSITERTSEHF